ncbi:MAG TPA: hypothetical protein VEI49_04040 [Terriglobales bacterium]|nr:hypothetical protein [Terriglobales bacterium]HXY13794.1 hypothetical protein [Terriglobales bacterium]
MNLLLVNRVLHIAATCTSLGGLFYARMVLLPSLQMLAEPERGIFLGQAIRRFAYVKWTGVTVVAITGIIQWLHVYPYVTHQQLYLFYFAIKMTGAFGLFSITFLLALPADALRGMQAKRAFWSGVNIVCGLAILVGAALMRTAH